MQRESVLTEYRRTSISDNILEKNNQKNMNIKAKEALKKALKKEGFMDYNIDVKPINTNGGNYLGELYEIDVTGDTEEGKKEVNIFMKKIIGADNMVLINLREAHSRELFFYKELQQIFGELQNEAKIPANERYKVPKSFKANDPDVIILENIAKKSYITYNRTDVVSIEFAEACMEQLAKFHGLSFVLEKKRPEYYNSNIKILKHVSLVENWDAFFNKVIKSTWKLLTSEQKQKLAKFVTQLKDRLSKYIMDTESVKCCLCHGDFRPNNIMMKEINGAYTDIFPIDYQILHYASPINDFLYFITICTDREFRKKNMTHLKDLYFKHLTEFLKHFEMDIEMVYPRSQFEKDLKERMGYGIVYTFIMAPFIFAPEDDIPDFEKDMDDLHFNVTDSCQDRLRDLLDDYIDWGGLLNSSNGIC